MSKYASDLDGNAHHPLLTANAPIQAKMFIKNWQKDGKRVGKKGKRGTFSEHFLTIPPPPQKNRNSGGRGLLRQSMQMNPPRRRVL